MSSFSEWFAPRRRVLLWITAGWSSFFVVFGVAWATVPRLDPISAPLDRLLLGLQLAAGPAFVLMTILQGLWRAGDTVGAEADPLGGLESRRFKINQRVMSNTVEQTLIFVPMLLAVSVRCAPEHVWLLPVLVGIWCVGRWLFWAGYQIEPVWRAIGMDWTSGAAMVTAGWLAFTFFA